MAGQIIVHSRLDGTEPRHYTAGAGTGAPGLPEAGRGRPPVLWLVRSEELVLLSRQLPVRRRRELEEALPYALEDDLVTDPADAALAYTVADGTTWVAVADRARLRAGFESLRARGLRPRAVVPDVLALPLEAGRWTLLLDDQRALVRTGPRSGFACRRENLPLLLGNALAGAPSPPAALAAYGDAGGLGDMPLPLEPRPERDALAVLAAGAAARPPLDLLAAATPQTGAPPGSRARLVAAGLLGALAVGLLLGARGYEVQRLRADNARVDAAIEAVYREAFPARERVVNARLQMTQQLQALRGEAAGTGFLALLNAAKAHLGPASGVAVLQLRYAGEALSLVVELAGLQALEQLTQALEAGGRLRVAVASVEKREAAVRVELRIEEAGP